MHLNKHISRSLQLQKYLSYQAHFFFFFKTLEIYCKFRKFKKNGEKIYGFSDSLIYVGNGKFSLSIREYTWFGVNMLSSSPKISDPIENTFSEPYLAQKDKKVS